MDIEGQLKVFSVFIIAFIDFVTDLATLGGTHWATVDLQAAAIFFVLLIPCAGLYIGYTKTRDIPEDEAWKKNCIILWWGIPGVLEASMIYNAYKTLPKNLRDEYNRNFRIGHALIESIPMSVIMVVNWSMNDVTESLEIVGFVFSLLNMIYSFGLFCYDLSKSDVQNKVHPNSD